MEEEGTPLLTKVAIGFGVLFFAACFQSCTDLIYRMKGKSTTGTVTKIVETGRRRGTTYAVYYSFTNENRTQKKRVNGSNPISHTELSDFHEGQQVPVEYYGAEVYQSRLAGRSTWWAPLFLIGSCFGLIATAVILTFTSGPPKKPPPKNRPSNAKSQPPP